jgi:polyphosphate kinase
VRREGHHIRRYVHLATGNYNPATARLYTDVGMFTCRPEFGEDATNFFNLLTGICQYQPMQKLLVAPFELHGRMLKLIERESVNAEQGLPARIIVKSITRRTTNHQSSYRVAGRGEIDLIVRGVCCLRPGVKDSKYPVRSIIDRSWSTAGFIILRTPASRRFLWAARTGCRGISFAASKWYSRLKTVFCASAS